MDNAFEMQFFGRKQGEPFGEIEADLITEGRNSACAGTVSLFMTVGEDMSE